jgi:hypothetical protein
LPAIQDATCHFPTGQVLRAVDMKVIDEKLIEAVTYMPQTGGTNIFSHLSPSGSAELNDLACIESGDARSMLVIAARRDVAELHVWRRLYLY